MDEKIDFRKYDTIGLIWNNDIRPDYLESYLNNIELDEDSLRLKDHELAVRAMDIETAQKYGQYIELSRSRCIATKSKRVVNFYLEYQGTIEDYYNELINYVYNKYGCIIIFGDDHNDLVNKILTNIKDKYPMDTFTYDTNKIHEIRLLWKLKLKHSKIYN